ncbi:type IV secretion system protein [Kribbella shirazensis]|uniref:TrbL/VirB6 plasmid conjugal transfer protein n=1 Tax=Kribbella shirazensis TaxID=1105143 RepID=A0A7X5ZYX0_9ACTN|nr:type IV secretion system protein [Kribbella shirazensis]NIK55323.1 hypothetical protein [Kribbella shirazensis]
MCGPTDLKCHVAAGVESVANGWVDNVNRLTADFFSTVLNSLATFWVEPKTPVTLATSSADQQTWTDSKTVAFMHEKTLGLTLTILAFAIVIAGIRVAWEQRAKPLQDLLKALLTFVVVCGCGTAVVQLLIAWSDDFAIHVVQDALGGESFSSAVGGMLQQPTDRGDNAGITSVLMVLLLGQLAALASLVQIVLMLIRSAMLVLLGSTLPLAAAATNTEAGRAWFKKYCAWTLGFIAYKPAAALIYAAALKLKDEEMLGPDNSGLMESLTALMMMLLAILALPAVLRLAVPATAAVAGGSVGMGSMSPDLGSNATGAVNVGPASGGRSGGGAGGGASGGGAVASGGGATGAATTGAKAAGGAALGPAGVAATAARKAAGAFAGAAAHSAGESGGGSYGASGSRPSGGRATRSRSSSPGGGARQSSSVNKTPAGATTGGNDGPSGSW